MVPALAIAVLVIVVVAALLFRFVVDVVTVRDYQRGLHFRNGKLIGLLSTGTHVAIRPFSEIQLLDGRPTSLTIPRQEILAADGVALRVSLVAHYVIADPVAAVTNDQSWLAALYAAMQTGLRGAIAGRTTDEILAARSELGPVIAAAVASELARIGVELLGLDVRDVMLPAELKRAAAGIVAARRNGEAALERARGETAALRSLANAGQLLDEHPALLQLRAIQGAEAASGVAATLELGGANGESGGAPAAAARPGPRAAKDGDASAKRPPGRTPARPPNPGPPTPGG